MLNTLIEFKQLIVWLVKHFFLFRLDITKGLNTYWRNNLFSFFSYFLKTLTLCVGQWNTISIYSILNTGSSTTKCGKRQGVGILSEGRKTDFFHFLFSPSDPLLHSRGPFAPFRANPLKDFQRTWHRERTSSITPAYHFPSSIRPCIPRLACLWS